MRDYKNILVVQTAFIGDIVLTTPLIKTLRDKFPASRISVLTTPQGNELLKDLKEIDSLLIYGKNDRDRGEFNFLRVINKVRECHFDLCLSPHRSHRTSIMLYVAGIPDRVGFSDASLSFLYNRKVPRNKDIHEVDRVLSLLKPVGVNTDDIKQYPYLEIAPDVKKRVDGLFGKINISDRDTVIAIAPGSVWPTKRWTPGGYASLIDRIVGQLKAKVLLVGSKSDMEQGGAIVSLCKSSPINLTGKTDLRELVSIISRCQLVIGNDSAPGHIAAARKVPVVSLFGPTVPGFGYAPYGEKVVVIEKRLPCRPCHHHGPAKCPEGHFRCMKDITVEDVMAGVERFLQKRDFQK